MENNYICFESLGAHLRNLLTPYATLIGIVDEILTAKREGDEEKMNKLLDALKTYEFNNIQDIIEFSHIELMEEGNWRNSKLFQSKNEENIIDFDPYQNE